MLYHFIATIYCDFRTGLRFTRRRSLVRVQQSPPKKP
nr:MAG TPA: hypothetical protein [Caudoviricetes sp.]